MSIFNPKPEPKSKKQILAELEREQSIRIPFYEKKVLERKLSQREAQHRIDCLQNLIDPLKKEIEASEKAEGKQAKLF